MKQVTYTRYNKGSTDSHTAFPQHHALIEAAICTDVYRLGPALPFEAITRFVHDCRFAVFRRRAVLAKFPGIVREYRFPPTSSGGTKVSPADDPSN
ncbi:hypothetical protein [Parapedobacter sp.]|uniref:hypothetical protein n=1 Tax=Parapedobacter sp. TaxID=1958893 RepID=UPI002D7E5FC8|nr:hypothetical protein [Parapedobacter sp.]